MNLVLVTIFLRFVLGLNLGAKEGDNVLATKTIIGISGASVALELVSLVITVPGTCSKVVVIRTEAIAAVAVSRVATKLTLLPGGGTVSIRVLLFGGKPLAIVLHFYFGIEF